ncbi:hypothetical protein EG329_008340 [Mollisiaceae sp. DMI_Dod_QoI]|nr:hypothetical protein EG329_008340 [Helotiales sp. DMI_Dod_QoI]
MAILSGVPGLEICIQSFDNNVPADLREYDDDGGWTYRKFSHLPDAQRSSKYVESKAGAEFRIRILLKHPFKLTSQSLTFKASVDGHGIAQASCTADYFNRASGFYMELISARLDRISASQISSRPLKFSSIKKSQPHGTPFHQFLTPFTNFLIVDDTDSTRVREDAKAIAGIGEIVISVFRTLQRDPILPPPANYRTAQHSPPAEVAEKALKGKAISHGVAYGAQQIVNRHIKETVDDLQAELIIPRTPSPEAPIVPRDRGELPAARRARLANLKREIEEIKAEEDDYRPQGRKRAGDPEIISSRAYKTSRTSTGSIVVDLTDD